MTELFAFIGDAMARSQDPEKIIVTVCENGWLREHLMAAVKDRALLTDALCYRHPNGFYKIKLLSPGADSWALRLHLWDGPVMQSDVHDHRWDFSSYIVWGALLESRFELERGVGATPVFELAQRPLSGEYRYTPGGLGRLRETSRIRRVAGDSYTLDHRVLHRADPDGAYPVVTAVLQGRDLRTSTTVVPVAARDTSSAVGLLDPDGVAQLMERVAERLAA
ncbi:hypothetical protein ACFRIC_04360 [Streptomyces sp. NPDC056738]|uniref:hypothetical protein n=1 Tax=Streptomyces sp. NPDC056738 TaxID=3345933 RepID=UPI0036ADA600